IGRPVHKTDILNWVLGRPSLEDRPKLQAGQREALFVLEIFAKQGLESAVRSARKFKPTLM
ncbi:MAG: peptidyl-tRNA hydrolase, partial [Desulfovibrionaceae bacterium]|nr:peptidyl-tRNA hydrolase [Desulfovibrionaceae bacterium]